jgi:hypothetical protein
LCDNGFLRGEKARPGAPSDGAHGSKLPAGSPVAGVAGQPGQHCEDEVCERARVGVRQQLSGAGGPAQMGGNVGAALAALLDADGVENLRV